MSTPRARSAAPRWTRRRSAGWSAPTATMPPATRSSIPPIASTTRSPRAGSIAACRRSRRAALAIIEKASPLHGPMEEQVPKFEKIIADAAPKGEMKPEVKAAEAQFATTMLEILKLSEFEAKDLTWKSFPNHVGHKDFSGLLPLPRRQALQRKGRGDPAAVHAVPRHPAGQQRGHAEDGRVDRDGRPEPARQPQRAQLDARSPREDRRLLRDVPRPDQVGQGRRQLLLQSRRATAARGRASTSTSSPRSRRRRPRRPSPPRPPSRRRRPLRRTEKDRRQVITRTPDPRRPSAPGRRVAFWRPTALPSAARSARPTFGGVRSPVGRIRA